jgi:hypothetical protein
MDNATEEFRVAKSGQTIRHTWNFFIKVFVWFDAKLEPYLTHARIEI